MYNATSPQVYGRHSWSSTKEPKVSQNERVSMAIIDSIDRNKDRDLRGRASEIEQQIKNGDRNTVLKWFNRLISIDYAKMFGLGVEYHTDKPGGWGFSSGDNEFLQSLRLQYLGNAYGVTMGTGRMSIRPLTDRQVSAVARAIGKPFYTLQLALVYPDRD